MVNRSESSRYWWRWYMRSWRCTNTKICSWRKSYSRWETWNRWYIYP